MKNEKDKETMKEKMHDTADKAKNKAHVCELFLPERRPYYAL